MSLRIDPQTSDISVDNLEDAREALLALGNPYAPEPETPKAPKIPKALKGVAFPLEVVLQEDFEYSYKIVGILSEVRIKKGTKLQFLGPVDVGGLTFYSATLLEGDVRVSQYFRLRGNYSQNPYNHHVYSIGEVISIPQKPATDILTKTSP